MNRRKLLLRIFDVLIIIATCITVYLGHEFYNCKKTLRAKENVVRSDADGLSHRQILKSVFLDRYVWKNTEPPRDVLDKKLTELNLIDRIMELKPETPMRSGSIVSTSINLRLSPIPSSSLQNILNQLEDLPPRFLLKQLEITRVSDSSDQVDIAVRLVALTR